MLVVFVIISLIFFTISVENSRALAGISLDKVTDEFDLWVTRVREGTVTIAADMNMQDDIAAYAGGDYKTRLDIRDRIRTRLINIYAPDMMIKDVFLYITASGQAFSKNTGGFDLASRYGGESWFSDMAEGKLHYHTGCAQGVMDGEDVLFMASAIVGLRTGDPLGLVYAEADAHRIADSFGTLTEGNGHSVYADNMYICGVPREKGYVSVTAYCSGLAADIEYRLSVPYMMKGYTAAVLYLLGGLAFLMLFIYLINTKYSLWFSRRIVLLENSVRQAASGDLSVKVCDSYADEISSLARSFNTMTEKLNVLIREKYMAEIGHKEAQLTALQSQMNPHFIYNTLESISMLAVVNDNYEIVRMCGAFADMMRYSLRPHLTAVPLSDEMRYIDDYVAIQEIRFPGRFRLVCDIAAGCADELVPPLCLQPLVENAFRHGFDSSEKTGIIRISARREDGSLCLCVKNNGKSIAPQRLEHIRRLLSDGMGVSYGSDCFALKNLAVRLSLMHGARSMVDICSDEAETAVTIRIPIVKEKAAAYGV